MVDSYYERVLDPVLGKKIRLIDPIVIKPIMRYKATNLLQAPNYTLDNTNPQALEAEMKELVDHPLTEQEERLIKIKKLVERNRRDGYDLTQNTIADERKLQEALEKMEHERGWSPTLSSNRDLLDVSQRKAYYEMAGLVPYHEKGAKDLYDYTVKKEQWLRGVDPETQIENPKPEPEVIPVNEKRPKSDPIETPKEPKPTEPVNKPTAGPSPEEMKEIEKQRRMEKLRKRLEKSRERARTTTSVPDNKPAIIYKPDPEVPPTSSSPSAKPGKFAEHMKKHWGKYAIGAGVLGAGGLALYQHHKNKERR